MNLCACTTGLMGLLPERTRYPPLFIFHSHRNKSFKNHLKITFLWGQTFLVFVLRFNCRRGPRCLTDLFDYTEFTQNRGGFVPALWQIGLCHFVTFSACMLLSWTAFCVLIVGWRCLCLYEKGTGLP